MIIKQKVFLLISLVIITMLSISQLLGFTKENVDSPYMPRQINLSGNIVNFSMPENFSKDMPADDLVESVNLNEVKNLKDKPAELLRRWWNFSDNSFFKKETGTLMMTMHLYNSSNANNDISHPVKFVEVLLNEMERRSQEVNVSRSSENKIFFPEYYQSFVQEKHGRLSWISSGSGTMDEDEKVFYYWLPVSETQYIEVGFYFSPVNSMPVRQFIDDYCRAMIEKVLSSFDVIYSPENKIKAKLEKNSQLKLEKLVEELEQKQLQ